MQWGPEPLPKNGCAEEIAAFVSTCDGRPAVLWPEHECHFPDSELTSRLTTLLGRPVLPSPPATRAGESDHLHAEVGDLLLIQSAGAASVTVTAPVTCTAAAPEEADSDAAPAPGAVAKPLVVRLRTGEILYLPHHYTAALRSRPDGRQILLQITADRKTSPGRS